MLRPGAEGIVAGGQHSLDALRQLYASNFEVFSLSGLEVVGYRSVSRRSGEIDLSGLTRGIMGCWG